MQTAVTGVVVVAVLMLVLEWSQVILLREGIDRLGVSAEGVEGGVSRRVEERWDRSVSGAVEAPWVLVWLTDGEDWPQKRYCHSREEVADTARDLLLRGARSVIVAPGNEGNSKM
jgi:hypothetical protein